MRAASSNSLDEILSLKNNQRMLQHFPACILCKESVQLTREHIIPQAIGGRLVSLCLCKACNEWSGQRLVPTLTRDLAVLLALEHLRSKIPELYKTCTSGIPYVAKQDDGSIVQFSTKDEVLRVHTSQNPDGTGVWDERDFERFQLVRRLGKLGTPPEAIELALTNYRNLPLGVPLPLPGFEKLSVVKRPLKGEIFPSTKHSKLVDLRLPVLMALAFIGEFLAGDDILNSAFDPLREFIQLEPSEWAPFFSSDELFVQLVSSGVYEPVHSIRILGGEEGLSVDVAIFGWVGFEVKLHKIMAPPPFPLYVEDLARQLSLVAVTNADGSRSGFYELEDLRAS